MTDLIKAALLWKLFPLIVLGALGILFGIFLLVCRILDQITRFKRRFKKRREERRARRLRADADRITELCVCGHWRGVHKWWLGCGDERCGCWWYRKRPYVAWVEATVTAVETEEDVVDRYDELLVDGFRRDGHRRRRRYIL